MLTRFLTASKTDTQAQWGIPFAAFGVIGYQMSPVYRGLTIPFKVFIQLSGMVLGGYMEADRSVRRFEERIRLQKRAEKDHAIWRQWEQSLDDEAATKSKKR